MFTCFDDQWSWQLDENLFIPECDVYSLDYTCPTCGAKMRAAAPLKFSPEDRQGERRRQRKGVGAGNWATNLPSIKENEGEEE